MSANLRLGWAATRLMLVLTVVLGLVLPTVVWGIGRVVAPNASGGSFIEQNGQQVGSSLIGQQFSEPGQFWGRPSAGDYDAMASGGSNQGPNSEKLTGSIEQLRGAIAKANGVSPEQVPTDAVTASGSGLDPLISRAYADLQVNRIAKARGLTTEQVQSVIDKAYQGRTLGFLGQGGVNVLIANLELDKLA